MYDEDGFYVLRPVTESDKREQIGKFRVIPINSETVAKDSNSGQPPRFTYNAGSVPCNTDTTEFALKSWQNKAWETIGLDLNWKSLPKFTELPTANKNLLNLKRLGICIKAKPVTRSKNKPVIEYLVGKRNYGSYAIADTPAEFYDLMSRVHAMLYKDTDQIFKKAAKLGFAKCQIRAYFKALAIYTDKSFDAVSGNPLMLQQLFGFRFDNKGDILL